MSEIDEAVDEDEEDPYDERLGGDNGEGMVHMFCWRGDHHKSIIDVTMKSEMKMKNDLLFHLAR
jgi:hypothetical protein